MTPAENAEHWVDRVVTAHELQPWQREMLLNVTGPDAAGVRYTDFLAQPPRRDYHYSGFHQDAPAFGWQTRLPPELERGPAATLFIVDESAGGTEVGYVTDGQDLRELSSGFNAARYDTRGSAASFEFDLQDSAALLGLDSLLLRPGDRWTMHTEVPAPEPVDLSALYSTIAAIAELERERVQAAWEGVREFLTNPEVGRVLDEYVLGHHAQEFGLGNVEGWSPTGILGNIEGVTVVDDEHALPRMSGAWADAANIDGVEWISFGYDASTPGIGETWDEMMWEHHEDAMRWVPPRD